MILTAEHRSILRDMVENHLAMRLRACRARKELKEAGYIAETASGNWRADRRHTYWNITPEGRAALAMPRPEQK